MLYGLLRVTGRIFIRPQRWVDLNPGTCDKASKSSITRMRVRKSTEVINCQISRDTRSMLFLLANKVALISVSRMKQ